jgi:hypothetical protein
LRVAADGGWTKERRAQPNESSPGRKRRQLSTALAALSVTNQKVLDPLPGTKLCSQPAGLFASPTPCLGGLVRVTVFRQNPGIRSTGVGVVSPEWLCLKSLRQSPQAFFKDALFISNPRRERLSDFFAQRPELFN